MADSGCNSPSPSYGFGLPDPFASGLYAFALVCWCHDNVNDYDDDHYDGHDYDHVHYDYYEYYNNDGDYHDDYRDG